MHALLTAAAIAYVLSSAGAIAHLYLRRDVFLKASTVLLPIGILLQLVWIGEAWMRLGHFPVYNLPETVTVLSCILAGVYLGFGFYIRMPVLGVFSTTLTAVFSLVAAIRPTAPAADVKVFKSFWVFFHVVSVFVGEAFFALACGIGIMYLIQESGIKNKRRGFFFTRMPSLEALDSAGYACIVVGFTLLTVGLVTGFVYAKITWGHFLSWDPKEVWSVITWILYAVLIHERLAVGWRGRKSAIMAIVGFGVVLFTFLGVNFLLEGHHGGFTRF